MSSCWEIAAAGAGTTGRGQGRGCMPTAARLLLMTGQGPRREAGTVSFYQCLPTYAHTYLTHQCLPPACPPLRSMQAAVQLVRTFLRPPVLFEAFPAPEALGRGAQARQASEQLLMLQLKERMEHSQVGGGRAGRGLAWGFGSVGKARCGGKVAMQGSCGSCC